MQSRQAVKFMRHGRGMGCVAIVLLAMSGCPGRSEERVGVTPKASREIAAMLPLSEVPPRVAAPTSAGDVPALSGRGLRHLERVRELLAEERYTEARRELDAAQRLDPGHPVLLRMAAVLEWDAGSVPQARLLAQRTLSINPDDAVAHALLGMALIAEGDEAKALEHFRIALLCSDFGVDSWWAARTHLTLARGLARGGYLRAAVEAYDAFEAAVVRVSAPSARQAALLAADADRVALEKSEVFEQMHRYADAAAALRLHVDRHGGDDAARIRYVALLLKAEDAAAALAASRSLHAEQPEVLELLRAIHRRLGAVEGLIEDLRERLRQSPDHAELALVLAEELAHGGKQDEAAAVLSHLLDRQPGQERVREQLAELLLAAGHWEDALRICAAGVRLNPSRVDFWCAKTVRVAEDEHAVATMASSGDGPPDVYVWLLRACVLRVAGRTEAAEGLLERSLKAEPGLAAARAMLAELYAERCAWRQMLEVAGRGEADAPGDARLERLLGRALMGLDDPAGAELHFKAALQLDRTDVESAFLLAQAYSLQKNDRQSRRQLQALVAERPDYVPAVELLVQILLLEGQFDEASRLVESFRSAAGDTPAATRLKALMDLRRTRDRMKFRETLTNAMAQLGEDVETWLYLARGYDPFFEYEQALEAYRRAHSIDPRHKETLQELAIASGRALDFEQAAEYCVLLLGCRPNAHEMRAELVRLLLYMRRIDEALEVLAGQLARTDLSDERVGGYRLLMLEVLEADGRRDRLLEVLGAWAAEEHSATGYWTLRLIDACLDQDRHAEALALLTAAHAEQPDNIEVLDGMISALIATGRTVRALQYALDGLARDPEHLRGLRLIAAALLRAEDADGALELIESRLADDPHRTDVLELKIRALGSARRHADLVAMLERLLSEQYALQREGEARMRIDVLRYELARARILAGEYASAARELVIWAEEARNPAERSMYLSRLALARRYQGLEQQADEAMEEALRANPADVSLYNDVAYIWIDKGLRLEDAESLIRRALAQEPLNGAYLDTFGWLLYKKGDWAGARVWLERAVAATPQGDPVLFDHLGDALWRLGERAAAEAAWVKALEMAMERERESATGFVNADERRARKEAEAKIQAVREGGVPPVAASTRD